MSSLKVHVITDHREDRFQMRLQGFIESLENNGVDNSSININYQFRCSPVIDSDYNEMHSALIAWKQWEKKGEDE